MGRKTGQGRDCKSEETMTTERRPKQSGKRNLAKSMDEQCRTYTNWCVHGTQRCQLPAGHTGKHFGPFNAEWSKRRTR
jgi:hypothetical protein